MLSCMSSTEPNAYSDRIVPKFCPLTSMQAILSRYRSFCIITTCEYRFFRSLSDSNTALVSVKPGSSVKRLPTSCACVQWNAFSATVFAISITPSGFSFKMASKE